MYRTANEHYKQRFGCKVYKLSVDAGFTCPNRDGKCGTRGCIFCSSQGGGEFAERGNDVVAQLEAAKKRVEKKTRDGAYIAYFQAFTGTYAPTEHLRELFAAALTPDYILGLAVATRPDCLPQATVDLLAELSRQKPVSVELGLQTSNDKTAQYIRRGYDKEVYLDAVRRLHAAGLEVVTHIIIGLPGETEEDALSTTRFALVAGTDGIKFHLLHVLKGTDLASEYEKGLFECLTLAQYGETLKKCIDLLPPNVTVHRITGDGRKSDLIAPLWSADKKRVLNYLYGILN